MQRYTVEWLSVCSYFWFINLVDNWRGVEGSVFVNMCMWSAQGWARICASHKSHVHPFTLASLWIWSETHILGPRELMGSLQTELFVWVAVLWNVKKEILLAKRHVKTGYLSGFLSLAPKKCLSSKTQTAIYIMHFWVGWGRAALGYKALDQSIIWK